MGPLSTTQQRRPATWPGPNLPNTDEDAWSGGPATKQIEAAAHAVADELVATAVRSGRLASWMSATVTIEDGQARYGYATGDPTVYQGSGGIAVACAAAAAVLDRPDLAELACDAARAALANAHHLASPGLHDGRSGIALAARYVADRCDDTRLACDADRLLDEVFASLPDGPAVPDVISGTAGLVLAALAGGPRLHGAARALGHRLISEAVGTPAGAGWPLEVGQLPLCGLAHGVSGVLWALAELAAALGDGDWAGLVFEAGVRYERSWLDPRRTTWPDLRSANQQADPPEAGGRSPSGGREGAARPDRWCHGGSGIGLVRFRLAALLDDRPDLLAEGLGALHAATATLAAEAGLPTNGGPAGGMTLCHGLGGPLELLLVAAEATGDPGPLGPARQAALDFIAAHGPAPTNWPIGVPGGRFAPGLFVGLAGTLLTLVRLVAPRLVPSAALFPVGFSPISARR